MLVLSRKVGERIVVGDGIVITVVRMGQGSVRIGVEAPNEMAILRQELVAPPADKAPPADTHTAANGAPTLSPADTMFMI